MESLYAYVDGSNLEDVEATLYQAFKDFVSTWDVPSAQVINDRYDRTPNLQPGDLPDWNLGLNADIADLNRQNLTKLVVFLEVLTRTTGREFAIGGSLNESDFAED